MTVRFEMPICFKAYEKTSKANVLSSLSKTMINNSTVDEHKNFKPGYRLAFKVYVIYEAVGCDMLPDSIIFVTVSTLLIVIKKQCIQLILGKQEHI